MANSALIRSVRDGATLELSGFVGPGNTARSETFFVAIGRGDLRAEAEISAFMAPSLGDFFASLAKSWRGWQGSKKWSSLEGEFALSATCDSTGHVALSVFLRPPHTGFHWELHCVLELEAGQLDAIAQDVNTAWAALTDHAA